MTDEAIGYVLGQQVPDTPLTGRNMEDFVLCPRKYLLSSFASRARTQERLGGPAALHLAVRSALLEAYRALPARLPANALVAAFEAAWDGTACRDSKEEEDLHRDGLRMVQEHHAQPAAVEGAVQVDVRLEGELEGFRFVAVADVLAVTPPVALRFVTSRKPPPQAQLVEEPGWRLLYLLARERPGAAGTVGTMADLRHGKLVQFALDPAQRGLAVAELTRVAGRIRTERAFGPNRGTHCRWCRSRSDCPAWRSGVE